jgi:hypothetical protein
MYFTFYFGELTLSCHHWNVGFYNNEGCMKKTTGVSLASDRVDASGRPSQRPI